MIIMMKKTATEGQARVVSEKAILAGHKCSSTSLDNGMMISVDGDVDGVEISEYIQLEGVERVFSLTVTMPTL